MLIRDLKNKFYFTTSAFMLVNSTSRENGITIVSNNSREDNAISYIVFTGDLDKNEAMDHIYKCYRRDDRCCDLNDLKKDKTK